MTYLEAILMAIVEGLTEYLPISSTGHLIITSYLMGINDDAFTKNFTVIVQFGAILSVVVLYWRRFLTSRKFYYKLFLAFLPAAVAGLLIKDKIDALLGDVSVVAYALIVGGIALILIDWILARNEGKTSASSVSIEQLSYWQSFLIGGAQCLAFIPGVSRSAATIVGGLGVKLNRKAAAEFSFFLAVPTLTAATGYKLLKVIKTIEPGQIPLLLVGNIVSFVVGAITIKKFIGYLSRHGFFLFGVYRIIIGVIILFI